MQYTGESLSLLVAAMWTATALFYEYVSKQAGSLGLNVVRLGLACLMLGTLTYFTIGEFIPFSAGPQAWFWLSLSGLVGYIMGDYCLFSSYALIGSRFGQLFMTLAPPSAAITGWILLDESMSWKTLLGMIITLFGIGVSILSRETKDHKKQFSFKLPLKGILMGIGAGLGQGIGLVLSKVGMNHYITHIGTSDPMTLHMVPFAATQIRGIIGFVGFIIIVAFNKSARSRLYHFKELKTIGTTLGGTFFGPFLGVSLSLMAVQYTHAGIASTLMALTPIIILYPAHYFYQQKITLPEILGALISVLGVSLFFI